MARFTPATRMGLSIAAAVGVYGVSFGALSTGSGLSGLQTCALSLLMFTGGRHSMLFPARPWHDLVAGFMVRTLLAPAVEVPTEPSGPVRR